jgi:uncharacterized protein (TIGR00369 family)
MATPQPGREPGQVPTDSRGRSLAANAQDGPSEKRTRRYQWQDSDVVANTVGRHPGLDVLRAISSGALPRPPVLDMLEIDPAFVEPGSVSFTLTPQRWHYNPLGSVHGGVLATLADTALGCAVHSILGAGLGYTTLEIKVSYSRAVTTATGPITATGTVLSIGKRAATAEARIVDQEGRLCAHATSTCLIFPIDPEA